MGKIIKILLVILVVVFALSMAKNLIVQTALGAGLSRAAHVSVSIGWTSTSFIKSAINLKNVRFHNPSGFPGNLMMDIKQVFIDFDPAALFKGQAHFEEVRLNLKEMVVVKDRDGRLNVNAMKPRGNERRDSMEQKKSGKQMKLVIDKLYLTIGRVVYRDYSQGGSKPVEQVFDVNIQDREYRNIQDPQALVNLIAFEALTRTTLSRLADLDIGSFKQSFAGLMDGGTSTFEETASKILSIFQ